MYVEMLQPLHYDLLWVVFLNFGLIELIYINAALVH